MSDRLVDLGGRRALVTGGSRGIGRATAKLLARAGADVGIGYRSHEREAAEVVRELEALGGRAWAEAGDLATTDGVDRLFERCDSEFGGLDILVANAGTWNAEHVPVSDLGDADWHRMIETNLTSIFLTVRAAARRIGGGGKIVAVSSTAGQRGEAGHSHYAATKGALISFVKSIAVELADRDVNVNAVAPGWVDTDMAAPALKGRDRRRIIDAIPLGRVASPEEIAGPIVFLCSDLARHLTGEVLNVNGGSVLCG